MIRLIKSAAIPLSILPLVAAGVLWLSQKRQDDAKPAAQPASAGARPHRARDHRTATGAVRLPSHRAVVSFGAGRAHEAVSA